MSTTSETSNGKHHDSFVQRAQKLATGPIGGPLLTLMGAMGAGFLIGRMLRRHDPFRTLGLGLTIGLAGGTGLGMLRPSLVAAAQAAFATLVPAMLSRFQAQSQAAS